MTICRGCMTRPMRTEAAIMMPPVTWPSMTKSAATPRTRDWMPMVKILVMDCRRELFSLESIMRSRYFW